MSERKNDDKLVQKKISNHTLEGYYEPSVEKQEEFSTKLDNYKRKILSYDLEEDVLTIFPIRTFPNYNDFLEPKYAKIISILLEGFNFLDDDIEFLLGELPSGFIKDYSYGLGLQKDYRFIIDAIEELDEINHLMISKKQKTKIKNDTYILNFKEYDEIRRVINRITEKYRAKARVDKSIFAFNSLLPKINPEKYEPQSRPYTKDTIFKMISTSKKFDENITKKDIKAISTFIQDNDKKLYKEQKEEIYKFINDIELISLKELIELFKERLEKQSKEADWQKLFNNNPFILNLAFGYPIIKIGEQVSVGGQTLNGDGGKITDFMVKNALSNNIAIIEIKKAQTKLLHNSEYRGDVYAPTKELSGSINQVLDQKFHLQQEIVKLKENSGQYDLKSYAINCVLIIGMMPNDENMKKSFELYRNNSKDIVIITFDELLDKLEKLYEFLSNS